jgi:DNA-binding response OmpR family regulator
MKKILVIIDFFPELLTGLQTFLEKENFEVAPVSDGQLGYERGRSEHFDLIILEIAISKKSNFDICRELRKDGITTPILLFADEGRTIKKEIGSEVGAIDYISKPFGTNELLAKIKTILG